MIPRKSSVKTGVAGSVLVESLQSGARTLGKSATVATAKTMTLTAGLPTPESVANVLLHLAASEEEPDYLTHLRLQKLMYYVQAWSLTLRARPAFSGRIEAWAHGPVVRELYAQLAGLGSEVIPVDALAMSSPLTEDDRRFVVSVWDAYKGFTAFSLREMTHKESPWIAARGDAGPADACTNEITHDSMRDHFGQQR